MISRLTGEFRDPISERAFREASFAHTRIQNRATAAIVALLFLSFGVFDYVALGASRLFFVLLVLRLALVGATALVFAATCDPTRHRRSDLAMLALQLGVIAVFTVVVGARAPTGMLYPASVGSFGIVMIVLGSYVFVSTRLTLCTAVAVLATLAYLGVCLEFRGFAGRDLLLQGVLLIGCNLLGFAMALRIQVLQRRQHAVLLEERSAKERLETQSRELTALAASLARARDDATIANRSKSEFLAHMSHELRSPLNAIIGFAEMMKGQVFGRIRPSRYREYVDDIHASGSHLLAVINDLLDLSKAESGKFDLMESTVDLRDCIRSAMRLVRERAQSAGVRLDFEVPSGLPELRADERMVKQIVLNLLTNAVKFTPADGSVTVRAALTEAGDIAIGVADTGIGIRSSDIPKVLEAYGQADVARARTSEGTGLGLPLVKSMVELHGGAIEIDSALGRGTTVTVRFPADRAVAPGAPFLQAAG